jgi:hypothetical protein
MRPHAEQQFADELEALARADERTRPPNWRLSPWAVLTYVLGGELDDGTTITPKYVGRRRLVETRSRRWRPTARCCSSASPAPRRPGCPSTSRRDRRRLDAARAGHVGHGGGGAALRLELRPADRRRPVGGGARASPVMRAMQTGKIARVEELTRLPSDVQDALITVLSEKTLPVPELDTEVQAVAGFNVIATANDRDRGVNELSSAMRRRFNTVVLPLPDSEEEEVGIVRLRVEKLGDALELPSTPPVEEIRRLVTVFRELREGVTEDGRTKLKSPTGSLSTAEAISVTINGLALAAHFGDGEMSAADVAAGLRGAVVKDPVQDRVVWQEYLETVVKDRKGWDDLYRACRELED